MHSFGDERLAPANGIELAYQEMGDADGQPLLLVMGLATQMLAWDEGFCGLLAERGFRVVRFDNRDIGRSTKIESAGVPRRVDMMLGRRASAPYLLADMAADTTGLMDHLGIDSAHVVGASMGGMIVQTMALEQPNRVRSMVSIMSNTGSRWTGMPSRKAMAILLGRPPRGREQAIERAVKTFKVIGSPGYPFDEERLRDVAGRSYDRGHSAAGVLRQLHAITASGDRTQALRGVRAPTTVIHGNSDPLVRPAGGRATARAIPNARLKMIDGMGHDLPRQLWPLFAEEIAANAARAGRGEAAKQPA
ncbi:MAG TPA: alpha/beta hydrolase [Solirubrobacterales bacterium]|jgi:pimeloyl-ACP methyl ester carboxylesterase|nr:alpha/beta hydrolase [Solirubrobacterales bacterium]